MTALELDDPDLEAAYFAGQRARIMTGEDAEEDTKPVENVWKQDYTEHEESDKSLTNAHGLTKVETAEDGTPIVYMQEVVDD